MSILFWTLLSFVIASAVYHLLCLYSASNFFRESKSTEGKHQDYRPPVTVLKPLKGAEEWMHECLASFCRQDYPDYEIIFGVREADDPAIGLIERLKNEFPQRKIKLVVNPYMIGTSAKVSNLHNMYQEASHEILVISDCDARVGSDYLRAMVAPLAEREIGLVTCLYRPIGSTNFSALMEGLGLMGEFALGVLVARQLEGVKFAFGASISTRKSNIEKFGGFAAIANYLGDDFLLGNLTAKNGNEVCLSPYVVETMMPPYSFSDMFRHQLRWARSTKFRRPSGYPGLIFTHSTTLSLITLLLFYNSWLASAIAIFTLAIRFAAAWLIGVVGFDDRRLRRHFYLLPIRDLLSFIIWVASFFGSKVYWCGDRYRLKTNGRLVPITDNKTTKAQRIFVFFVPLWLILQL